MQTSILSSGKKFSKQKVRAKTILFYDGENLERLIWEYQTQLPKKYSPLKYWETIESNFQISNFIQIYFFRNAVSHVQEVIGAFENYVD